MAQQITDYIYNEFPDYVEMNGLLNLAARTWPLFGISASELSESSDYEQEMLRIYMTQ